MENDEPKGELAKPAPQKITTTSVDNSDFACFLDTAKFNQLWRVAQVFAGSQLVPQHYINNPSNCFIAMQMSIRLNVDPMMFMQNTFIIHGKPGMESKLVIALINARGPFEGPIQWKFEGKGDKRSCTAYAKHKMTGEVCQATVSWEMATKEGWTTKSGSKWKTMPDLMFQYRSAVFLGRLYCPECLMGMRTIDELIDIKANDEAAAEAPAAGVAGLKERMAKQVDSKEVEVDPPEQIGPAIDATLEAKKQEQIDALNQDEPTDAEQQPEPEVVRWKCNKCDREFPHRNKNHKCPHCFSDDLEDRKKPVEPGEVPFGDEAGGK